MAAHYRSLSAADVAALLPPPAETLAFCEGVLRRLGNGESWSAIGAGAQWTPAERGPGAAKTATLAAADGRRLLSVDAEALSIARDAACTAIAARCLADPATEVITILGCNARTRAVMASLLTALPKAERMLCFDPDIPAQGAFADEIMTTFNLASVIPPEPRECTEGAHVIVSCLRPALKAPVVERDWLQTGTLCVTLDVDKTFTPAALAAADRRITDELSAWKGCAAGGHFPGVPAPDSELGAIVAGKAPGRPAGKPIVAAMFIGHPALDAALAAELLQRAEKQNRGQLLPV